MKTQPSSDNDFIQLQQGTTLLTCLVVLVISIILLLFAIPSWHHWQANTRSSTAANRLIALLYTARTAAIEQGKTVSICASADGQQCASDRNWSAGQLVFIDAKQTGKLTDPNQRVRFFEGVMPYATITWRGFPNRSVIQFLPTGFPREQNGTFAYCPNSGDARTARVVILSKSGRARIEADDQCT